MKAMSCNKINLKRDKKTVNLQGVSTCRAASFKCILHIHLSLRQGMTYQSLTSISCSLSHFEVDGTATF